MKNIILGALALILIGIILFCGIFYVREKKAMYGITSFVACAENGYPVMESHPRQCKTPDGRTFVEELVNTDGNNSGSVAVEKIRVTSPVPGQAVSSPIRIQGEARGMWYFEASFPARLLDANGKEIAVMPIQAQGEWMTEDFVPFEAEFTFGKVTTPTGTLVLHKDNPSGLPEYDDQVEIPIVFASSSSVQ